jgi:hypothetical protein
MLYYIHDDVLPCALPWVKPMGGEHSQMQGQTQLLLHHRPLYFGNAHMLGLKDSMKRGCLFGCITWNHLARVTLEGDRGPILVHNRNYV